jgi:ParB family chromosome partitioning protein
MVQASVPIIIAHLLFFFINTYETENTPMFEFFKKQDDDNNLKIVSIPIGQIAPNPNQPRKYFDSKAMEELSDSIAQYGLIQPITVRRCGRGYELIAGERRFRACIAAGLKEVPAVIIEADNNKSAILALLENLQREDLSFFEIAESYKSLIREQGMTQAEIALKMGKSQSSVANKIRLLKLPPRVKKLIRDYNLTERHARALLLLNDEEKQLDAVRTVFRDHLSVSQTEELVHEMLKEKTKKEQNVQISTIKDVKVFKNTVKKALDIMKRGGVEAHMEEIKFDWGTEYIIRVKNGQE